ncbi:unnamed protein product [Blepharisma stoltei]|uniref:Lebercilin domain-containing protein n=1 Tax=Blepharisma stoltei TaxID=1481888 RepID=A0AAU9II81_9CILI|nr:unnamed protein product [Blepharisma stoltei]
MKKKPENFLVDNTLAVNKLKNQNAKLKTELRVLKRSLEEAISRQRKIDSEKTKIPQHNGNNTELEKELNNVYWKINDYKKDINEMKMQLIGNLKNPKITDLENRRAFLKKQIEEVEAEFIALQNINVKQEKALDAAAKAQGYPEKNEFLRQELKKLKDEYREKSYKQQVDEKNLKARHELFVDVREKCKALKEIIAKKNAEEDDPIDPEALKYDIPTLERKIKEIEEKTKEDVNALKLKIKDLETHINDSKHTLSLLQVKLKEKDQETRICMLKIRELRRAVSHTKSLNKLGLQNRGFDEVDLPFKSNRLKGISEKSSFRDLRLSQEMQSPVQNEPIEEYPPRYANDVNEKKEEISTKEQSEKENWEQEDRSSDKPHINQMIDMMSSIDVKESSVDEESMDYRQEVDHKISAFSKPNFAIR